MSNKAETTAMKHEPTPALTPKLRFPEFRDAAGWKSEALGSVCEILNNRRRPITSDQRVAGPYPYYGASGIVDYVGEFIFDERLLLVGEDGAKWQAFEKTAFIAEGQYWVNNHAHVLKPIGIIDTLLENYLTMADLAPFVTGAAPPKLTLGKLKAIPVPVPPTPAEQQKIADCLSSVDELIAAQARKVAALKTHKKGLMQQLFPREGETQPRLRFPEFQNAGEWESAPLGQLLVGSPDYGVNAAAVPFSELLPKYLRITDISEDGTYLSEKMVSVDIEPTNGNYLDEGDIALARTGASVGKSYRYRKEDGRLVFAGFLIRIKPAKKKLVSAYLANFLTTDVYWDWVAVTSTRSGQPGLNSAEYSSLSIPLPPGDLSEQQRIADCLTSLDALITAETQKHEALKTHKQGLMQQLFPSPEEVEA